MTRHFVIALGAACAAAACAPAARAQGPSATAPSVAAIIRAGVALTPASLLDDADVSPLHMTAGPQLGDGMLCLRTHGDRGVGYIAVFFERGTVINYRRAVAIDHCTGESYAPLPPVAAAAPHRGGKTRVAPPDGTGD
ncbi:MAG: hypothetical protein OJF62_003112 [Pseudolabrys sp.]|nr:hypothetical protein [Pseudolabrys sp.]